MVAVAVFRPSAVVFPPQQSPTFGQRASSQTVCKFRPRRSFLILLKEAPDGIEVFRKEGNRGLAMSSETFGCISLHVKPTPLYYPGPRAQKTLQK